MFFHLFKKTELMERYGLQFVCRALLCGLKIPHFCQLAPNHSGFVDAMITQIPTPSPFPLFNICHDTLISTYLAPTLLLSLFKV